MDTSLAYKNGRAKPSHLFEIFGNFSGHDAIEVRELLLEHIAQNLNFHVKRSTVCLEMWNTCFPDWSKRLADGRTYCDELGLLSLSALYRRHTLVITSNKLWSTVEHSNPLNLLELLNECSVKLVYLGHLRFGELKPHPRRPTIPIPIKSSTNINKATEDKEPVGQPAAISTRNTETEATVNAECVETNHNSVLHVQTESDGPNVVTTKNIVHVEMDIKSGHVETKQSKLETEHVGIHSVLHVVTTSNPPEMTENAVVHTPTVNTVEPALAQEDPDDTLPVPAPVINVATDRPPKTPKVQTCTLKLKPLRQLDIDVWCNKVVNYHKFKISEPTADTPNTGEDSGYTLRKRKTKADITGISL